TSQTAVCNQHHSLEQRFCRWLLMSIDRLHTDKLGITQEMISNLLGTRRESITLAVSELQTDGVIASSRGHIIVLDRPKLEKRACECYEVVKQEHARLFHHT
ncbi:MAG: helix-turn-helix domain-containing protein, partial [Burkholderiaceae bacterium]